MTSFMNKFKYFMGIEDLEEEYDEEYEYDDYDEVETPVDIKTKKLNNNVVNIHTNASMRLMVHEPINYEDAPKIIDDLKSRKTVIVNLEQLDSVIKRQIFDFINGGLYALEGNIYKVTKDIFVLAPDNVEIDGKLKDDIKNFGTLGW